jgi:predicted MFS family arabinose efflux permease
MSGKTRSNLTAPFAVRSFRYQFPADLLTSWGVEMEVLILGWFILVETGSVLLLTLYGSLQYMGTLVSPLFGMAGDRFGHRNVLCLMRAVYAVLALVLTALAFADSLEPTYALLVAAGSGIVRPSDIAMRNALVAEIVPAPLLMGAMGVSRTTSDSARVIGALAGAGLLAAMGMTVAYLTITLFYLAGMILTGFIGRGPTQRHLAGAVHPSFLREVMEGMRYVWRTPCLLAAMWLAFLVNLTAFPITLGLLPYVAREIYHIDQTGLGTLVASFSVGALFGSIAVGMAGRALRPARMMVIFSATWYVMLLLFVAMPDQVGGRVMLVAAGFSQSFSMVPMAAMLLHVAGERYRGRVMGVRMLAIYGLPLGLMASGVLIQWFGFVATATTYCVVGLVVTAAIALWWKDAIWPLSAPGNAR